MKKEHGFLISIFMFIIGLSVIVSAAPCELSPILLNQDPYPAVPGDYVKVVFQINGTENPECGKISFEVLPQYPFSLDATESSGIIFGPFYVQNYPTYVLEGYKLRVDKDALDGANKIKVRYKGINMAPITKEFDIEVEDARTDFDLIIQDYVASTNTVTFAILNVGKKDAEALTLEVPKQENLNVLGNNKLIIGSLNSNDDTTISMQAVPKIGEILVRIYYNDKIGVRRTLEKTVMFSSGLLESAKNGKKEVSTYAYLFWGLIILWIIYMIYGYYKRKARAKQKLLFKNLR
ncbi:MAG: hypothetical protein QXD13_00505 [Candidatus Pacearchaeota archaeon]